MLFKSFVSLVFFLGLQILGLEGKTMFLGLFAKAHSS